MRNIGIMHIWQFISLWEFYEMFVWSSFRGAYHTTVAEKVSKINAEFY